MKTSYHSRVGGPAFEEQEELTGVMVLHVCIYLLTHNSAFPSHRGPLVQKDPDPPESLVFS